MRGIPASIQRGGSCISYGGPSGLLECGIVAHGFLRLARGGYGHDELLALTCKRQGFRPSCGARRMSQTAAHRVDHVIPHVPAR